MSSPQTLSLIHPDMANAIYTNLTNVLHSTDLGKRFPELYKECVNEIIQYRNEKVVCEFYNIPFPSVPCEDYQPDSKRQRR